MNLLQDSMSVITVMTLLSLIPVFVILTTSFIKISMVLILTRESLGVQQVPPNVVIYGLSLILSCYIMGPVYNNSFKTLQSNILANKQVSGEVVVSSLQQSTVPLKQFLLKHSSSTEQDFFFQSLKQFWTPDMMVDVKKDDVLILIPSFLIHELTAAFKIGFLIYLPSIIIDIIVSNILMAMGMMMMSPVTISLPIKILLFISLDGWSRLIRVLMHSY